ncbi:hypothetical protein Sp245p_24555 (plasmid) [Azospirillum baldaniorum]|uniref:Uncharacterized protein n=1 Tax=Azospirillum baldaniorum TaxID=1064539 RepID=A0A9P1JYS9_9PROT|nr:hypothetical protein Sp245p_24555 [Azospirillum baldaniorum]CCD02413.1 protein of unknown function [Azospirillum baldaniorum]
MILRTYQVFEPAVPAKSFLYLFAGTFVWIELPINFADAEAQNYLLDRRRGFDRIVYLITAQIILNNMQDQCFMRAPSQRRPPPRASPLCQTLPTNACQIRIPRLEISPSLRSSRKHRSPTPC